MRFRILFFFSFILLANNSNANEVAKLSFEEYKIIIEFQDQLVNFNYDSIPKQQVKFKRGKAILFTVLTGLFGGHRIYFGTHHRTPIIYSVTLGGLGVLPLVDLINIIFTKDLSKFENKHQIIMWGK